LTAAAVAYFIPSACYRTSYAEAQAAPIAGKQSKFSSGPKCPRCEKTVYFAEEIIAVGKKWHKTCLKCSEFLYLNVGAVVETLR